MSVRARTSLEIKMVVKGKEANNMSGYDDDSMWGMLLHGDSFNRPLNNRSQKLAYFACLIKGHSGRSWYDLIPSSRMN